MRQPDEFCQLVLDLFQTETMLVRVLERYLPRKDRSGPWMTSPTLEEFQEIEGAFLRQQEAWTKLQACFRFYRRLWGDEAIHKKAS